jgi:hypothetical protein
MSTPTSTGLLTDLLGPTPKRFRTPTPDQRAARRAAAADRARLAAEIDVELDAALARVAAERATADQRARENEDIVDETTDDDPTHASPTDASPTDDGATPPF